MEAQRARACAEATGEPRPDSREAQIGVKGRERETKEAERPRIMCCRSSGRRWG